MIVFIIKSCFFIGIDNYNLGWKLYTSQSFSLFCEKMITIIYAILAIVIKDLKLHINNKNFPMEKNVIQFELFAQKSQTNKYFNLFFSSP